MSGFSFLSELSESKLFPSIKTIVSFDHEELCELVYIYILGLEILSTSYDTEAWTRSYCAKTVSSGNFSRWRTDGTDLYCLLHAIDEEDNNMSIPLITSYLKDIANDNQTREKTRRVFVKLDDMFKINESSLKAIRRLVMDWDDLDKHEKKIAMTRLLQIVRARMSKCEILPVLSKFANINELELDGVCNKETGDDCGYHKSKKKKHASSFLSGLAGAALGYGASHRHIKKENATAGSTGASSIATAVGGLGAGFDPNGDYGVYSSNVIKRNPDPVKKSKRKL